jgi:hypothetical protein
MWTSGEVTKEKELLCIRTEEQSLLYTEFRIGAQGNTRSHTSLQDIAKLPSPKKKGSSQRKKL